jgi:hypothetical protein
MVTRYQKYFVSIQIPVVVVYLVRKRKYKHIWFAIGNTNVPVYLSSGKCMKMVILVLVSSKLIAIRRT